MLVTVGCYVGSPGVSTLALMLARSVEAEFLWDADPTGSAVAVWAGYKPSHGRPYGWAALEGSWAPIDVTMDATPPWKQHVTEHGGVPVLAGQIQARQQQLLEPERLARWATTDKDTTVVADCGRIDGNTSGWWSSAQCHVMAVRADIDSMWRTWPQHVAGTIPTVWALLTPPKPTGMAVRRSDVKRQWGTDSVVLIPWDPDGAVAAARGKHNPKSKLWKAVGQIAELVQDSID